MVDHAVTLQAIGVSQVADQSNLPKSYDLRPTILKRTEQDFIGSVLDELRSGTGIQALTGVIQSDYSNDTLTFLQPVHRTFYLVILEIACDPFNQPYLQPRLDPRKIESAGLVVRRVVNGKREGWRKQGHSVRGWISFDTEEAERLDPDPDRRPPIASGLPQLDRLLTPQSPLSESVAPLYVAPPDVCQAVGRTILYGVIPVTSSEFSEAPPIVPADDAETVNQVNAAISDMLPYYLRPDGDRGEPLSGRTLTADQADDKSKSLRDFLATLQQLKFQFRLFDADPASVALLQELNRAIVSPDTPNAQPLGDFLALASRILIDREAGLAVTLPQKWMPLSKTQNDAILTLSRGALMSHLSALTAGEGRFEALESLYQVRAFVRLKSVDACVHAPIWSDYSDAFSIAPWYESSNQPLVKVVLPDILDPKTLNSLKPSVAFSVPSKLFGFLNKNSDPASVLKGDAKDGDDGGITWICSFNIPIITLCAYLVLNIFLKLFNIIFWWMLIVKICLPVPKKLFPKPK